MNSIAGSRYPQMFGQGPQDRVRPAKPSNKGTNNKQPGLSPGRVLETHMKPKQHKTPLSKEKYSRNRTNQTNRKSTQKNAQQPSTNHIPGKVSFRGGRPFGQVTNKTGVTGGKAVGVGGRDKLAGVTSLSRVRPNVKPQSQRGEQARQKVLQQSNTRVNFVKELIREEAAHDSIKTSTQAGVPGISGINIKPQGIGPQVRASPLAINQDGQLTINLYVQPDTAKENQHGQNHHESSLIPSGVINDRNNVISKEPVAATAPHYGDHNSDSPQPSHAYTGSISLTRNEQRDSDRGLDHTYVTLEPDGQVPVGRQLHGGPPSPPRHTIGIDGLDKHNAFRHGHSQSEAVHAFTSNNNITPVVDHIATEATKETDRSDNDLNDTLDTADSPGKEYDYYSDYNDGEPDKWATSPGRQSLSHRQKHMMDKQHNRKSYPQSYPQSDHRTQFERRLDDQIQQDMHYNQNPRYRNHRYTDGISTPDNLKELSAKHYLSSNNRLDSREPSATSSPRQYQDHQDPRNHRNRKSVHTNTGNVQYLMRNRKKRDGSSVSSVSTIHLDNGINLPNIHSRGQPPQMSRARTKRVKDSDAQTELNGEDMAEMDEFLPPTQEMAIQTQKPRSMLVEEKEIPVTRHKNTPGVEIGVQVSENPREVSTQTHDVPKTVSTSTEDLMTRKSLPKSPKVSPYKSQSLYGHVRDIIDEESNPNRAPTKADSGYQEDGESRYENLEDDLVLDDMEDEVYVLYMKTEDGALIGPLKLVINDAMLGSANQPVGDGTAQGKYKIPA